MDQVNNFINSLDNVARNDVTPIFIPSLNREVTFKKLSARQHKEIITTVMDNAASGITLALVLDSIIRENINEKVNVLSTDKKYIAVALRAASLSPTITLNEQSVDLTELLKNKLPLDSSLSKKVIKEDLFTLNLSIPTLDKETHVNKESRKRIGEFSDKTLAKDTLGEVYTKALVKYIDSIVTTDQGTESTLNFDELSVAHRALVVDKLPLSTTTQIIAYANALKVEESKFANINGQPVEISIDQAFFTL